MLSRSMFVSTHRAVEQRLGSDPATLGSTVQVRDAETERNSQCMQ